MIFLVILFAVTLQNGVSYDLLARAPDDYFNYYRSEDRPIKSVEKKFGDIKYTDLLSIIHNEDSNKALLDRINEYDELDAILNRETSKYENETEVEETIAEEGPINIVTKEIPDLVITEDADTLKEDDLLFDDDKPILDRTRIAFNDQEMSRRDESVVNKEQLYDGEVINTDINTDQDGAKSVYEVPIFEEPIKEEEPKRIKRSVLKVLRSLVHTETTPAPVTIEKKDYHRAAPDSLNLYAYNSLEKLISNLTESITHLNKNLAALKYQTRDDRGYVLIKLPLNDTVTKKFLPSKDNNTHPVEPDLLRTKRGIDENLENVNTNQSNDSSNINVSRQGVDVLSTTEHVISSILSDSEIAKKNDAKEAIKIKRDVNISDSNFTEEPRTYVVEENSDLTDSNNSTDNSTHNDITSTGTNNDAYNKPTEHMNSYENEKGIPDREIKNETTDLTDTEVILNNSNTTEYTNNDTNILEALLNGRRNFGSRDELLNYIDQVYNEIKVIINPITYIRGKFSENAFYKIGYIIANLETMDASLKKLKEKMYIQGNWESPRLQKVLRKLYMSKKLVVNIMEYLNKYAYEQESFVK